MSRAAILEAIHEFVDADDPWTSRERIRDWARKTTTDVDLEVAERVIRALIRENEIVYWHGLVMPADTELLRTAIEREIEAETTRKILVGKLNKIMSDDYIPEDGEIA